MNLNEQSVRNNPISIRSVLSVYTIHVRTITTRS